MRMKLANLCFICTFFFFSSHTICGIISMDKINKIYCFRPIFKLLLLQFDGFSAHCQLLAKVHPSMISLVQSHGNWVPSRSVLLLLTFYVRIQLMWRSQAFFYVIKPSQAMSPVSWVTSDFGRSWGWPGSFFAERFI